LDMPDEDHRTEVARGELRASHDDRDKVVEQLRVAAGDGRLTAEELDQRLELALRARTYGELAKLVVDLPAASSAALAGTSARPKDLIRIDCRSGHAKRDGRWIVPQRMDVKVTSGSVVLDFTEAVITQPMLQISAEVRSGHLRLITKPGIVVDADDVTVRSGHIRVKSPWRPDIPEVLRVELSGKVGSGEIKARPPFRSFWAWLTRQPRPYELMRG